MASDRYRNDDDKYRGRQEETGEDEPDDIIPGFWPWILNEIRAKFAPTYKELVEEKEDLKEIVLYWRYPNGMPVPPKKRGKLMSKLKRLSRKVRNHPDRPHHHKRDDADD